MTRTHRDVARRRRWRLAQWIPVYGNIPAVMWLWQQGVMAGALATMMLLTMAALVLSERNVYRRGYWNGRSDVHAERTARALGIEPTSCHGAEPWAPRRNDGELIDEILGQAMRGQR